MRKKKSNPCAGLDRPWTPVGRGYQISRQSTNAGGNVVEPTPRPPLPPRKYPWYGSTPRSPRLQAHLQLASLSSCHRWGECAASRALRSVRFCNRNGKGASILADSFVFEWYIGSQNTSTMQPRHAQDAGWSVLCTRCRKGKWVGRGGHLASDTWWLLSRDWGGPHGLWDSHCVMKNHVVFVELLEAHSFLLEAESTPGP